MTPIYRTNYHVVKKSISSVSIMIQACFTYSAPTKFLCVIILKYIVVKIHIKFNLNIQKDQYRYIKLNRFTFTRKMILILK